eukprot:9814817-Prorocentrum_lima.AAC.1
MISSKTSNPWYCVTTSPSSQDVRPSGNDMGALPPSPKDSTTPPPITPPGASAIKAGAPP